MRAKQARPTFTPVQGIDAVQGKCKPCQAGEHDECTSLRDEGDDVYPYFDAEDGPGEASTWVCPCLNYSAARHMGVHGRDEEEFADVD